MKDMKLRSKMMWSFMWVTIIALIGAAVRFWGVYQLGLQVHTLGSVYLPTIDSLLTISQAQTAMFASEQGLLNFRLDREVRQRLYKKNEEADARATKAWQVFQSIARGKTSDSNAKTLVNSYNEWQRLHERVKSLAEERDRLTSQSGVATDPYLAGKEKELLEAFASSSKQFESSQEDLHRVVDMNREGARIEEANAKSGEAKNSGIAIFFTFIGLILAVVFAAILSKNITEPINRVALMLSNGSEKTTAAAEQVSRASQQLAGGAAEQAASLEETSASLEEMASMTRKNAENAQRAKDLAGQTREAADAGTGEMKDMNVGMETIKTSVREMGVAMAAIKTSSDEISKIIKTIDEIAFQTNILALNAAVEAARAGEYGMGFAVVADEVRNLAQRSAQAAKETAQKIEDSIRNSEQGVRVSEKVAQGLLQAVNKANEVDLRLKDIVGRVHQVDELVAEIAVASREQSQGIEQIDNAVNQMDRVTQSNAGNAEETASAAEELKVQADFLKHSVEDLVSLVEGKVIPMQDERLLPGSRALPKGIGEMGARGPVPVKVTIHPQPDPKDAERPAVGRFEKGRQGLLAGGAAKGKAARDEIPMDQGFKGSF